MQQTNDRIPKQARRTIQGASAGTTKRSVIPCNPAEHLDFSPPPDEHDDFIQSVSLERLVYWKLQKLVDSVVDSSAEHEHLAQLELLKQVLLYVERPLFALVLSKTGGNLSKAADILGCNRNTLHRKLREFNLEPRDLRRYIKSRVVQKLGSTSQDSEERA